MFINNNPSLQEGFIVHTSPNEVVLVALVAKRRKSQKLGKRLQCRGLEKGKSKKAFCLSERKNRSRLASTYGSKLNCGMKTAFLKTPCPKEEGKKKGRETYNEVL